MWEKLFHRPHPVYPSVFKCSICHMCTFQRCCAGFPAVVHVSQAPELRSRSTVDTLSAFSAKALGRPNTFSSHIYLLIYLF